LSFTAAAKETAANKVKKRKTRENFILSYFDVVCLFFKILFLYFVIYFEVKSIS